MPHTDTRQVIPDYWYSSEQIIAVGQAWQAENPADRIFLYGTPGVFDGEQWRINTYEDLSGNIQSARAETVYRTALELSNLPENTSFPKKILLPINESGNHWTAITLDIQTVNNTIQVNLSYTNSSGQARTVDQLNPHIQAEIIRIQSILHAKYTNMPLTINNSIYAHTWRQPDGSSCGPYSLANAMRCLAGIGHQANPGRISIREAQLNRMPNGTAMNGCSTSTAITPHHTPENMLQKTESMRQIIFDVTQDAIFAYETTNTLVLLIQKGQQAAADQLLQEVLDNAASKAAQCHTLASDIIQLQADDKASDEKLIYLAKSYKGLSQATKLVEKAEAQNPQSNIPRVLLNAHVILLQKAINRNEAAPIRHMYFAIQDFCSSLLEFLTNGLWQSDIKRIKQICEPLKNAAGIVSTEQLKAGQRAANTILNAASDMESAPSTQTTNNPICAAG
jgi:hypothetical protein